MVKGQKFYIFPKHHKKVFGSNDPVTINVLTKTIFNVNDDSIHSFGHHYLDLTPELQKFFWKKYVEQVPIDGLRHVANLESMEIYGDVLTKSISEVGIEIPLLIVEDTTVKGSPKIVLEGHHRAGAAKSLGMKTVPAFVIRIVDFING